MDHVSANAVAFLRDDANIIVFNLRFFFFARNYAEGTCREWVFDRTIVAIE
jgi:hypothetical protein